MIKLLTIATISAAVAVALCWSALTTAKAIARTQLQRMERTLDQ